MNKKQITNSIYGLVVQNGHLCAKIENGRGDIKSHKKQLKKNLDKLQSLIDKLDPKEDNYTIMPTILAMDNARAYLE